MAKPHLTIVPRADEKRQPERLTQEALERYAALVAAPAPLEPDNGWIEGEFVVRRRTAREAKAAEKEEALFAARVQHASTAHARAGIKRPSPKAVAAERSRLVDRYVPMVIEACAKVPCEPAGTKLNDIKPHLPAGHGASDRVLIEALRRARFMKKKRSLQTPLFRHRST